MNVDLPGTYTVDEILSAAKKAAQSLISGEETWDAEETCGEFRYVPGSVKKISPKKGVRVVRQLKRALFPLRLEIQIDPLLSYCNHSTVRMGFDTLFQGAGAYSDIFPAGWAKKAFEKFLDTFYKALKRN